MKAFVWPIFASYVLLQWSTANAAEPPRCRLDETLVPIVRVALEAALEDLRALGVRLPFDRFVVNPKRQTPSRTMRVFIIKDGTVATGGSRGCLRSGTLDTPRGIFKIDGPCLPTNPEKCSPGEVQYMYLQQLRFAGNVSRAIYDHAGACYTTNLQACEGEDRIALSRVMGERDEHSVGGGCVTEYSLRPTLKCSAGAIKMLLPGTAGQRGELKLALLFLLSHELGHLAERRSSRYEGGAAVVDLRLSKAEKIRYVRKRCALGSALRGDERAADALALRVTARRLPKLPMTVESEAGVVLEAVHSTFNLTVWNNWWDDPSIVVPELLSERFSLQEARDGAGGFAVQREKVKEISRRFLEDLSVGRDGKWDLLFQSGSTHGTMSARMAGLLSALVPTSLQELDVASWLRYRRYLAAIEAEVCEALLAADEPPKE